MRKFESSQKDESRAQSADSSKSNGAQPAAVRRHAAFDNEICGRPHVI